MRFAILALAATLTATTASASQIPFDGSWKHQKFSLFSGNDYTPRGSALDVSSDASVSLFYRALPETVWRSSGASWDWQVSQSVPPTNLALKGGDDRNLALYFVFLPQAEAERSRGKRVTRLLSSENVTARIWARVARRWFCAGPAQARHAKASISPPIFAGPLAGRPRRWSGWRCPVTATTPTR